MNIALAIAAGVVAVVASVVALRARKAAIAAAEAAAGAQRRLAGVESTLAALKSETDERELMLASMDDAIILSEGRSVVYANPAAQRLFGAHVVDALPPPVELPENGVPVVRDIELHHPEHRDVRISVASIGGDRFVIVGRDETETRRIDRTRRDFVANASHEMKTPVSAILATAETLQTAIRDDPSAATRFSATLVREAHRLSTLVQDLLSLARLEQPLQNDVTVSWSSIVSSLCEENGARVRELRLSLRDEIASDVAVRGRAEDLHLLTRNLLDNAIRYTPAGGSVTVTLHAEGADAVLEVKDTGVGIPQKDLPRIFERFFRVDQAHSSDTGGTGLGLAIVRHVAESHGGAVTAQSELGIGSTFRVALPRAILS